MFNFLKKIFRKDHYFFIKVYYHNKTKKISEDTYILKHYDKSVLLNYRNIKKAIGEDFIKKISKKYLCNGFITVESMSYLGKL